MKQYGRIREAISKVIPGYEPIGEIDTTRKEFQITGRTFHEPHFKTNTGRANFHAVDLPALAGGNGHLRLMTVRSEGQFNTVVYEDEDIYRGQDRRDVIMMNKEDIVRMGLMLDQPVTVKSDTGALGQILVRGCDIPPGNAAMYYPEANVLVPRKIDPASKTPAFKGALVTVEPS
jgi:anaerobic selenocysteine-containing dehydrogenase